MTKRTPFVLAITFTISTAVCLPTLATDKPVTPATSSAAQAPTKAVTTSTTTVPAATDAPAALSDAEQWVLHRTEPWAMQRAAESKKHKHPVRTLVKSMKKDMAAEAHQTFADMGKDMAFVFSVQDVDPYDKSQPPVDKPCVVMEINLVDGTTAYLHRFPDDSFAVEGGFADNTVILPTKQHEFTVKYPNGAVARMVRKDGAYQIFRPDDSVTTITKNPSGDYSLNNDKLGFMGTAHPDETGLQYELGTW